jgi:hypothetical protein
MWLIGKLMIHLDSNVEIQTSKELIQSFLKSVLNQNREFVELWLSTQQISVYLENEFQKRK